MANQLKGAVEIHIPSELGYEKIPIFAVGVIARKMGFSPDRVDNLKMAIGEAVTNAIEHGNQLNAEANVFVGLTVQSSSLTLDVVDQGQQPIPEIPAERGVRDDNRGWGMLLIKDLVDEVEVVATPGYNKITMVARLEE